MSWSTRPIPPGQGDQLRNFLQPSSVTKSLIGASMVLWRRKKKKLERLLSHDPPLVQTEASAEGTHHASTSGYRSLGERSEFSRDQSNYPTSTSLKEDITVAEDSSRLRPSQDSSALQRLVGLKLEPDSDLQEASVAFKWILRKTWTGNVTPPRGVFYIHGLIGFQGPQGICNIYATGEYDPATEHWFRISVDLKSLVPFKQRPRGGG